MPYGRSIIKILGYIGIFGVATAISLVAKNTAHPVTAALSLMMAVILVGASGGLVAGLSAASVACLVYVFFIRFPVLHLGLESIDDYVPLIAFTLAAVISGILSGKLRDRARTAENALNGLNEVLAFSVQIQNARCIEDIVSVLYKTISAETMREQIIERLRLRYPEIAGEEWQAALDAIGSVQGDVKHPAQKMEKARHYAIADLLAMAIERCELLGLQSQGKDSPNSRNPGVTNHER